MKQLEFDFGDRPPEYHEVSAGGTFEHKSGDCVKHGTNVCFFRLYKASGPHFCVACTLEIYPQDTNT